MARHKRNEKTVQPPLKNLCGIQMLDLTARLLCLHKKAVLKDYDNKIDATKNSILLFRFVDNNNNCTNFHKCQHTICLHNL